MKCPTCHQPLPEPSQPDKPLVGRYLPAVYSMEDGWSADIEFSRPDILDDYGAVEDLSALRALLVEAIKNDNYAPEEIPGIYDTVERRILPVAEEEKE